MSDREITTHVYIDLEGEPLYVGRLHTHVRGSRERASLEYAEEWRQHEEAFPLSPALSVDQGEHHTRGDRAIFAPLTDSAPDRWGRRLIARRLRRQARERGETPRTLHEIDFLLEVSDLTRQGALRFARERGGAFLADRGEEQVPPLVRLPELVAASNRIIDDVETREDLELLLAPGSSLGGARPKASVETPDGSLRIAKFPARGDDWDRVRWEAVALQLAEDAGIETPDWELYTVEDTAALVLGRFDREGTKRIPYLSAMGMLDTVDHDGQGSYALIADALRRHGAAPGDDLPALWRRLVFNILISNTDDHLRNHGFLYDGPDGWTLSPAFDLNPVPRPAPRVLSTPVWNDENHDASLELAREYAEFFRVDEPDAVRIIAEVTTAVSDWRAVAHERGLPERELERLQSAFEHDAMEQARAV